MLTQDARYRGSFVLAKGKEKTSWLEQADKDTHHVPSEVGYTGQLTPWQVDVQFPSWVGIGYHPAWSWASTAKGGWEVLGEPARPHSAQRCVLFGPYPTTVFKN